MKKTIASIIAFLFILSSALAVGTNAALEQEQTYLTSDYFGDYFVGLKTIMFLTDENGENIVILSLDFSHSKWTKKTYYWNINVEVSQNNKPCKKNEQWSSDNRHEEIKAGEVQAVDEAFILLSDSPILIVIEPGVNFATGELTYIFDEEIPFEQPIYTPSGSPIPTLTPTPSLVPASLPTEEISTAPPIPTLLPTPSLTPDPMPTEEASTFSDFGEQLSIIVNHDSVCVLKYKIKPSYNNEATIKQNYYTVENFILYGSGDQYSEIQYWAVADMTDGSVSKVISFTLSKKMIQYVKNRQIAAIQFGEYVDELWIHPCLLD